MLCRVNAVFINAEKVRSLLVLTDYATTRKCPFLAVVAGNSFVRRTEILFATARSVSIHSLEVETVVSLISQGESPDSFDNKVNIIR